MPLFHRFKLRDADQMFMQFFDRWYDDECRQVKGFPATRPDMIQVPEFVGQSAQTISLLSDKADSEVLARIETMCEAAMQDWPIFLPVREPINMEWIDCFDRHYDVNRATELACRSDPLDFSNDYLVVVCEFGAMLGRVMIHELPRLQWRPSLPYWESALFDSVTGYVIPVFHWAIKKFSTYGIDDGFKAKAKKCLKIMLEEGVSG